MPATAGIQSRKRGAAALDPRFRGGDERGGWASNVGALPLDILSPYLGRPGRPGPTVQQLVPPSQRGPV